MWALELEFGSQGWDIGLEAGIWASGLDFVLEARIWALRLGFGLSGWDLGLRAGIWASRLGFELGGGWTAEKKEKEEKEKIPHMCESIGHRPLWGRCPASPSTSSTT